MQVKPLENISQIEVIDIMTANGSGKRAIAIDACFCLSGINSTAGELICKGRDWQYGVYSMLAVVIII